MNFHRNVVPLLTLCMVLGSCRPLAVWNSNERTGLTPPGNDYVERSISAPLDPRRLGEGSFDLYYFVRKPSDGKLGDKTVLFSAGGPGEVVQRGKEEETLSHFLSRNGYNVVYFHLRGSGFSQIPQSNVYDRFLKTVYAVEDIEKIRQDFLGDKKWDGIIGWSYGTVLAQEYASKYPEKVGKLVLAGPVSNHKDDFSSDIRAIRRTTLKQIYQEDEFSDVSETDKAKILDELFGPENGQNAGIIKKIVDAFGNEEYVIDQYCELKQNGELKNGLEGYSLNFFEKLREIHFYGWQAFEKAVRDAQVKIGKVIAVEVKPELSKTLGKEDTDDECVENKEQGSERTRYAMWINDGFLSRVRSHLRAKIGDIYLKKIGLAKDQNAERWDPSKCPSDRPNCLPATPTLVLKGGADPVSAGGQAEYIITEYLRGPRTFVEFPGIGHRFDLPNVPNDSPFLSGTLRFPPRQISPGLHRLTGRTDGLTLVKPIELIPPDELRPNIEVVKSKTELGNLVTVLILNKGPGALPAGLKEWKVRSPLFTGTVRLDPGQIPVGGMAEATGPVAETKIFQQLAVVLPERLKPQIDIISVSFRREVDSPGYVENYVAVTFRNKIDTPLPKEATRNWNITHPYFTGKLRFVEPTEIPGRAVRGWMAELVDVKLRNHFELVPPKILEPQLEVITANLDSNKENRLVVAIKNITDNPITIAGRTWTVHSPFYTATVRLGPENIKAKETVELAGTIKNMKIKPSVGSDFNVKPPTLEEGLRPEKFNYISAENVLSVVISNTKNDPVVGAAKDWTIESPLFTATVRLEPNEIPGKATMVSVTGVISKIQLNDMTLEKQEIKLIQPKNLPYEVVSGSERVESEHSISVLIRNKATNALMVAGINWIFIAPAFKGACQAAGGGEISSRDCLIYAFVEMDYEAFSDTATKGFFEEIQNKFKELDVTLLHCDGRGPEACKRVQLRREN